MGPSFGGLANYLVGDESRVEWAETRNMNAGRDWGDGSGRDAFTAREVSAEMERRAVKGKTEEPMYHITIAFDPNDRPTDAELRGAVDRTLRDMGLDKHQALVVCHNDKDHEHVHVMVNRIGKDGRAWSPWQDQIKLRSSMEAQERELGVRWTGKNRELAHEVKARASEARERQADVTERKGRAQPPEIKRSDDRGFATEVRTKALVDLKESKTWAELDHRLEAHGLRIERRGQGAVVTDGEREAKLSTVSRSATRGRLETRLGPLREYERGRAAEREPERKPSTQQGPERENNRQGAGRQPERRGPGRPTERVRPPSLQMSRRQGAARTPGSRPAGSRPTPSRSLNQAKALRGRAGRVGRVVSGEGAEVDPARVVLRATGRVALGAAKRSASRTLASQTLAARAVHRDVRPGGRVDRLAALVAERRALGRIEAGRNVAARVQAQVQEGRARLAHGFEARARATGPAFDRALGAVYASPPAAKDRFAAYAQREGTDAAARVMAERPEAFGTLRPTETKRAFGLVTDTTTAPAQAAAPAAARAGLEHGRTLAASHRAGAAAEAVRSRAWDEATTPRALPEGGTGAVLRREARTSSALRAESVLSPSRAAAVDRKIGRLAERVGAVPNRRGAGRGDPLAPKGTHPGKTSTGKGGGAKAERVQRAVETRIGTVGMKTVARAAKVVERGVGRE